VTHRDRESLDRIMPPAPGTADWSDVLRRAGAHRARGGLARVTLVTAAVVVVAGAASAFGTMRELFLGTGVNSKIAFMHNTRKNCCPHELWVMDSDGSNPVRVARDVTGGAVWSPDEQQIAYWQASRRGSPGNKIYVVRQDGSGRRLLTKTGLSPSWSPDGQRIAFTSWRDRNWEIYVMNAGGGKHRNLTRNAGLDSNPVWSPDGRRIAFGSERDGNLEIYVMNADGSHQRNVTRNDGDDAWPVWSRDGQQIAFMSRRDGNWGMYIVNADGSDLRNLTRDGWSPAWSPDGQRIAFISRRSGLAEIYVMNADGSDQRSLRVRVRLDSGPGWSPDGRKIAYTMTHGGAEVYVVNADGSGRKQLTRSPWANWFVGWSPGPRKGA
jgi:TolB protein